MDVSGIIASNAAKYQSITVEKETPLDVDAGLLIVTDLNPIDDESYNANLEDHLRALARDGVQSLIASLFVLPTQRSEDGPLAQLPPPKTALPRAKPLPKPKPPTKWEQFAAAKGIQHKVRDKREWDEERQEWVNRWGRDGKNKRLEEQWITEVPANADVDYDPRKVARDERKARVAKNEKQRLANAALLPAWENSTSGLRGEKKVRGVKRKFEPTEQPLEDEKNASLALISRMGSDAKKTRREPASEENVLNAGQLQEGGAGVAGAVVEAASDETEKLPHSVASDSASEINQTIALRRRAPPLSSPDVKSTPTHYRGISGPDLSQLRRRAVVAKELATDTLSWLKKLTVGMVALSEAGLRNAIPSAATTEIQLTAIYADVLHHVNNCITSKFVPEFPSGVQGSFSTRKKLLLAGIEFVHLEDFVLRAGFKNSR
ncbi:Ribosome biogenesis regulatory protein [Mycena venus]|uniref:Ribosome biogenesis regulatory protein n=1 Tax=Mycena venus TaxID=2733690 RepID=A0A8H6XB38_9AGAR|nr:Ribosome biogenesis regulatory protein [Mycena venus]